MKNIVLFTFLAIAFFVSPKSGFAQHYVQKTDASGIEVSQLTLDQLQIATDNLLTAFPVEFRDSFNVYDFGFYFQNDKMNDSIPVVWENM
ncbi:hypothetical protein N9B82_05445, partial [Saprospiraceae bacterium]|nr:hypothetical protein [Saprospiraceae bacterium]